MNTYFFKEIMPVSVLNLKCTIYYIVLKNHQRNIYAKRKTDIKDYVRLEIYPTNASNRKHIANLMGRT